MRTRSNIINEKSDIRLGSILLAKPFWQEDIYSRSVILLIDLSADGSTGIILNKMSNLTVNDALPEMEHPAPLYYGGPVNKKIISYVHGNQAFPDSYYLGNGLFWGGSYEYLLDMVELGKLNLDEYHFSAGFVQWERGELRSELNEDKWWVSEISKQELFVLPSENLWEEKLVEDNHPYGLFNLHPDPSLN